LHGRGDDKIAIDFKEVEMKIAYRYISVAHRPVGGSYDRGSGFSVPIKHRVFLVISPVARKASDA
jgi:hypothetical protein